MSLSTVVRRVEIVGEEKRAWARVIGEEMENNRVSSGVADAICKLAVVLWLER